MFTRQSSLFGDSTTTHIDSASASEPTHPSSSNAFQKLNAMRNGGAGGGGVHQRRAVQPPQPPPTLQLSSMTQGGGGGTSMMQSSTTTSSSSMPLMTPPPQLAAAMMSAATSSVFFFFKKKKFLFYKLLEYCSIFEHDSTRDAGTSTTSYSWFIIKLVVLCISSIQFFICSFRFSLCFNCIECRQIIIFQEKKN